MMNILNIFPKKSLFVLYIFFQQLFDLFWTAEKASFVAYSTDWSIVHKGTTALVNYYGLG